MGGGSGIGLRNVSVRYGRQTVLSDLTLDVRPGEIVALIGPSGSGKTTALRAVAGFAKPSAGRITIGARDVTDLPPYDRQIGMVVQNYALFPHMRVEENVAFGLRARGAAEADIRARVPDMLAMVGMASFGRRYPRELSGGQQQRVAIARAIAGRPQVLLLDEPLSALDAQIRRSMVDEIARLHDELPDMTVLYVTHDQSEALTLANRIGIMRNGRLEAFGETRALFREPPGRFAAEFLGRANLLPVSGLRAAGGGMAEVLFGDTVLRARNPHGIAEGAAALLCVRPHQLRLDPPADAPNRLQAVVQSAQWQGESHAVTAVVHGQDVRLTALPMMAAPAAGTPLVLHMLPEDAVLVPGV